LTLGRSLRNPRSCKSIAQATPLNPEGVACVLRRYNLEMHSLCHTTGCVGVLLVAGRGMTLPAIVVNTTSRSLRHVTCAKRFTLSVSGHLDTG
jgi:hypothetical protein